MSCQVWYKRHDWTKWRIDEEVYASVVFKGTIKIIVQSKSCRECRLRQFKRDEIELGYGAKLHYRNETREVDEATLN